MQNVSNHRVRGKGSTDSDDDNAHTDDTELESLSRKQAGSAENSESESEHEANADASSAVLTYTAAQESAVIRKLDKNLVVFLALLYMLSFLDRSNIGNAKIAGMTDDLNLSSEQYEWVLTAFYLTYVSFEWMTLLYKLIPPHIYISLCVASWGLVASFQCLAGVGLAVGLRSRDYLLHFGPGVPFYLSFFYNREELALRTGLFISAAPLATSFASSLAWVIVRIGTWTPIASWRLLFLVEGFPSVIVSFIAWSLIPDRPAKAKFLTIRERKIAEARLRSPDHNKDFKISRSLQWREIGRTLSDPKSYVTALMFFSCNVAFSSLPPFLPTIINEMHFSALTSQALSAPPYLFAFVVVIFTTWASDRNQARSPFLMFHSIFGALGYGWLALSGHLQWPSVIRYAGTFVAAAGFFSAVALTITWSMDNRHAAEGKGTSVALLNIIGQLGPLVGTRLYPKDDAPYYVKGMSVCAAFMLAVGALTLILRAILRQENRRMAADSLYEILEGEEDAVSLPPSSKRTLRKTETLNIL